MLTMLKISSERSSSSSAILLCLLFGKFGLAVLVSFLQNRLEFLISLYCGEGLKVGRRTVQAEL